MNLSVTRTDIYYYGRRGADLKDPLRSYFLLSKKRVSSVGERPRRHFPERKPSQKIELNPPPFFLMMLNPQQAFLTALQQNFHHTPTSVGMARNVNVNVIPSHHVPISVEVSSGHGHTCDQMLKFNVANVVPKVAQKVVSDVFASKFRAWA